VVKSNQWKGHIKHRFEGHGTIKLFFSNYTVKRTKFKSVHLLVKTNKKEDYDDTAVDNIIIFNKIPITILCSYLLIIIINNTLNFRVLIILSINSLLHKFTFT